MADIDERRADICPPSFAKVLNNPIRRLFQNPDKLLQPYVKEDFLALDIGCGGGYFTASLSKFVGAKGKVIAVDMQEEMFSISRDFVRRKGVPERVEYHLCSAIDLKLDGIQADFALAFYMVHEGGDAERLLHQIFEALAPGGIFFVMEPKAHVPLKDFEWTIQTMENLGMKTVTTFDRLMSRGAVMEKSSKK